jgi:peptide/nickel transport system substrate-binding protein
VAYDSNKRGRAAQILPRRRVLQAGAIFGLGAAGASLVGCGDDDSGKSGKSDIFDQPSPTPTKAAAFKRGGKHVSVWETEPSGQLDPHIMKSGFVAPPTMAIFNGFMRQDFQNLGTLIGELAASWEQPDPATFVFKLRKGIKFHDGTDYNAEIAKWNAERILGAGFVMEGKYTGAAAGITKIQTPDADTITFTFDKAKVDSIEAFYFHSQGLSGAVSRQAAEAAGKDFWKKPVGTGPYKFKSWDFGARIVMERNPDYFEVLNNEKLPFIDQFEFIALPEPAVRVVNVKNGQVSSTKIEPDQVRDVESNEIYIVQGGPEPLQFYPNHQSGIFKDVRIRRALAYAINRDAVAKTVFFGQAQPNIGIPKRSKWYDPSYSGFPFDPKRAKDEMSAAGFPNGFEFEAMVLPTGARTKAVEFMQAQLAEVGIKVKLAPTESAAYVDRLMVRGEGDSFFALTGNLGLNETGGFDATALPNPGRKQNPNDPKMAELLDKIKTTFDVNARKQLIWDAQKYYFNDLVAMVPVIDSFRSHAVRAEWQGFGMVPPDAFYPDFRQVRLKA